MWGPTFYRHSEGANIAFFDGHTEYLSKEKVFFYYEGEALAIHISTIGFGSLFLLTGAGAKKCCDIRCMETPSRFQLQFSSQYSAIIAKSLALMKQSLSRSPVKPKPVCCQPGASIEKSVKLTGSIPSIFAA